ncbi:uncharacterized protein EAE97_002502 [Botrytis byssoidea]|uniref:2EXR domain-containing protein n=1 Tax=Botrytis byssoidea TaxID=139641 RepID=A0A9P5IR98_9HELO|nr:uncharacterized protein EAE97_002502 [Botrytis byssoidea]KAF7950950.1 hypothetical protein EAE97_002502 [Botrytis byssoidea]
MNPENTFPHFLDLPLELRVQIWELAAFHKRILELNYDIVDKKFVNYGPPPAILHTNRESRKIALQSYNMSFGTDTQPADIYFNPVCDTIYFSSRQYVDEVMAIAKHFSIQSSFLPYHHQIQSIALAKQFWGAAGYSLPFHLSRALGSITRFRSAFPHMRKVILVRGMPSEEEVDSWDRYSGITLLESNIDEFKDDILSLVMYAFAEDAKTRPDEIIEVKVMEHPQKRCDPHFPDQDHLVLW